MYNYWVFQKLTYTQYNEWTARALQLDSLIKGYKCGLANGVIKLYREIGLYKLACGMGIQIGSWNGYSNWPAEWVFKLAREMGIQIGSRTGTQIGPEKGYSNWLAEWAFKLDRDIERNYTTASGVMM